MSTHNGNGAAHAAVAWEPESPFLPTMAHESAPQAATAEATAPAMAFAARGADSPFALELDGEDAGAGPLAMHHAALVGELWDGELDEAIADLVEEGAAMVADREEREADEDPSAARARSEQLLRAHYAPLAREAHLALERMAASLGDVDLASVGAQELDARLATYEAPGMPGAPVAFEQFLGGLVRKAKKAIRGVAKVAGKVAGAVSRVLPVNLVLGRLKALVNPVIERVLRFALDRLPVALRPAATQLAQRLLGIRAPQPATPAPAASVPTITDAPATATTAAVDGAIDATSDAAAADPAGIQEEADAMLAGALVAGEAFEQELAIHGVTMPAARGRELALRDLRRARRRFARRIVKVRDQREVEPEVEEFLPAALAAAKLGVKVIGRPRVVKFLAGLVSKLIARHVGPQQAAALSTALVDTGLRLVSLEAPDDTEHEAAGRAVASTVENTVNHLLAAAPDAAWENEALLESYALEAFEQAASAAFPDVELRAESREAGTVTGAWATVPALAAYEKYTATPEVTITPQQARDVRTFGGGTLAEFLRARYALAGDRPVRARLHLYRALAGTTLGGIAARERVRGLGAARREARTLLHPLTPDAARTLLGEPGLGAAVDARFLERREVIAPLQRFYYLELQDVPVSAIDGRVPRSSQVRLVVDVPAGEVVVHAFWAEPDAQELAARMRTGDGIRALPLVVRPLLERRLRVALSGKPTDRVRVVHPSAMRQAAFRALGAAGAPLAAMLTEAAVTALQGEVAARAAATRDALVAAADAPADGLTITFRIAQPAFLPPLARMLGAASPAAADVAALLAARGTGGVRVQVGAGLPS